MLIYKNAYFYYSKDAWNRNLLMYKDKIVCALYYDTNLNQWYKPEGFLDGISPNKDINILANEILAHLFANSL